MSANTLDNGSSSGPPSNTDTPPAIDQVTGAISSMGGTTQDGAAAAALLPTNTTDIGPDGSHTINQQLGTSKSAAGKFFIAFTEINNNPAPQQAWVLGRIVQRTIKLPTAKKSHFKVNWHNFTLTRILDKNPNLLRNSLAQGTTRNINLEPGGTWAFLEDLPGGH